jgi:hypothetical protein
MSNSETSAYISNGDEKQDTEETTIKKMSQTFIKKFLICEN